MKFLVLVFLIAHVSMAQNIVDHTWKERVITILADTSEGVLAKKQTQRFLSMEKEMIDRQLVLYSCIDDECTFYDFRNDPKKMKIKTSATFFKTSLYGLDGQIKSESNELVSPLVFFVLIDKMPMRRSEMRKRIKKNGGS